MSGVVNSSARFLSLSSSFTGRFGRCSILSCSNLCSKVLLTLPDQNIIRIQIRDFSKSACHKKDQYHISECFDKSELNSLRMYSDSETAKVVNWILKNSNAMITEDQKKTLELNLTFSYGKPTIQREQPDIYQAIKKGHFSKIGSKSESVKVFQEFENIISQAKVKNADNLLFELYRNFKTNPFPCLLIGLYCSKELSHLRAPHTVFCYLATKFSSDRNKWTEEELDVLQDNLEASDDILLDKIPRKTLYQIKHMSIKLKIKNEASIFNEKYSSEDDKKILKYFMQSLCGKPETIEEFNKASKRVHWSRLAQDMGRIRVSLAHRFNHYIKPVIQCHLSNNDLEETITKLNQYIINEKIGSKDQINYDKFPQYSKEVLNFHINLNHEDYKKKEPLWVVVQDRIKSGKRLLRILPQDERNALIKIFETYE